MKNSTIHTSTTQVKTSNDLLICELGNGDILKAASLSLLKDKIIASVEKDGEVEVFSIEEEQPINLPVVVKHFLRINYLFK